MSAKMTRADKAYLARFAAGMASYVVLLPIALWLARGPLGTSALRFAAILLVLPALVAVVWAVGRYATEADELQARVLVESLAIAFAAGSLITFTWGMMQVIGAPSVNWMFVMPVYLGCWLIAGLMVRRRY